jgi:large subunit ribosomal protein L29
MSLPKYNDLKDIKTLEEINQEIFILQKNLFDLRLKRSTSQAIKPHLFKHSKRRLAQLKFKSSMLLKSTN